MFRWNAWKNVSLTWRRLFSFQELSAFTRNRSRTVRQPSLNSSRKQWNIREVESSSTSSAHELPVNIGCSLWFCHTGRAITVKFDMNICRYAASSCAVATSGVALPNDADVTALLPIRNPKTRSAWPHPTVACAPKNQRLFGGESILRWEYVKRLNYAWMLHITCLTSM